MEGTRVTHRSESVCAKVAVAAQALFRRTHGSSDLLMERKKGVAGFTGHHSMIACRTCTEEEGDPELKQLCGKMEEVCEKNNMELSKRECYFGRGEKTAR